MSETATFCATCFTRVPADPPAATDEAGPAAAPTAATTPSSAAVDDDHTNYRDDPSDYGYQPAEPQVTPQSTPSRFDHIFSLMFSETPQGIAIAAFAALLPTLVFGSPAGIPGRLIAQAVWLSIFFIAMRMSGVNVTLSRLFWIVATANVVQFVLGLLLVTLLGSLIGAGGGAGAGTGILLLLLGIASLFVWLIIMATIIVAWTSCEFSEAVLSLIAAWLITFSVSRLLLRIRYGI